MPYSADHSCVYLIRNKINNHCYVGSAAHWKRRRSQHLRKLRNNTHSNHHLQHAFNQYGEDAFDFQEIEIISDLSLLLIREQFHIDALKPEYNILRLAGNSLGYRHTIGSLQKMSEASKSRDHSHAKRTRTDNEKRKLSEANKDKPKSEVARLNMSKAKKGKPGRQLTDKDKLAVSKANSERVIKPETRSKLQQPRPWMTEYWKRRREANKPPMPEASISGRASMMLV